MKNRYRNYLLFFSAFLLIIGTGGVVYFQNTITARTSSSYAASVYNLSAMAQQSDVVLLGSVDSLSEAKWPSGQKPSQVSAEDVSGIYRAADLRRDEVLKGDFNSSVFLRVSGGRIGDYVSKSESSPSIETGTPSLMFLENMGGYYVLKGGKMGLYSLEDRIVQREAPERFNDTLNLTREINRINSTY